jgi:hypothetical protein
MSYAMQEPEKARREAPSDLADDTRKSSRSRAVAARLPPPVRFVDDVHRARTLADAERARAIVLMPICSGPGQLRSAIEADFESVLASRGAMPSSIGGDAPYRAIVEDQLARAAALPVRGVCLSMPVLGELCEAHDSMNEDDLRALSVWVEAAKVQRRMRVVVLLSELDRDTTLLVPRRLEDHLAPHRVEVASGVSLVSSFADTPRPATVTERPIAAEPYDAPAVEQPARIVQTISLEVAVSTPDGLEASPEVAIVVDEVPSARSGDTLKPAAAPLADTLELEASAPSLPDLDLGDALAQALSALDESSDVETTALSAPEPAPAPLQVVPHTLEVVVAEAPRPEPVAVVSSRDRTPPGEGPDFKKAMRRLFDEEPAQDHAVVARVQQSATYRSFAMDLDAAKGPKPVAVVEKLFAQRYVPLLGAAHRGELDGAALAVAEQWRASFAESYESAYPSMRATGKRPTMVMDAPDVATRVARLSSARSIKLVLVDSMSFDLGERVQTRIGRALDKRAVLVESTTLWSALPTRTYAQMHLLAKGPEGLKDPVAGPPSEPDVTRGRTVASLRRERCGSREIMKLDLVEARLRGQGPAYDERLDGIADEVTEVLVKFMETQPPRTLVYVFGDHGFVLGAGSNGWATGAASQGGASPEEVLVGGYGFLVDAVQ